MYRVGPRGSAQLRRMAWIVIKRPTSVAELNRTFSEVGVVVVTRNLGTHRRPVDGAA